ncbi:universal stress protein [uncultured Ralstonia sp.]|jgi:nucleotide-binding universal stress UspA family protein|uniref:universal stress protein n=1 Tax=Ralstonia sp. TaxID=54061 RepID=UPI001EA9CAF4|nr:universal stress protein [uncultured Ralstonia sp.]UCF22607.1 MAG: universal stress protein [Ralstonia sp.]
MYDKILVAVDGSQTGEQALDEAIRLAARLGAELSIVHVIDSGYVKYDVGYLDTRGLTETLVAQGKAILSQAQAKAEQAGVRVRTLLEDDPLAAFDIGMAIEDAAHAAGAQLLVLGTHGRRGVRRLLLGSVAEGLVRQSALPVLLVRGVDAEPAQPAARETAKAVST